MVGRSSVKPSFHLVAWPSGLRRWFKAPVSSEAWVRIPPLPQIFVQLGFYILHRFDRSPSYNTKASKSEKLTKPWKTLCDSTRYIHTTTIFKTNLVNSTFNRFFFRSPEQFSCERCKATWIYIEYESMPYMFLA